MDIIYCDNAATGWPKPEKVYLRADEYNRKYGANPGRSGHKMAMIAGEAMESARAELSFFLGASSPSQLVFTANATDALNMAVNGFLKHNDHVVTTDLDHNSLSRPLNTAAREKGVRITRISPVDGVLSIEELSAAVRSDTALVCITHISNVTGRVQDIAAIGQWLKDHSRARLLVDAAQSAGVWPIHCVNMGIDLLAFTGHKGLQGPMGSGGLVVAPGLDLSPWRTGGSGIDSENPYQPDEMPFRLEAGTPNFPGIVGLGEGVRYIRSIGLDEVRARETGLRDTLLRKISTLSNIRIYSSGIHEKGAGIVTFNIEGLSPSIVSTVLDSEFGIAVRSGLMCAPYCHKTLGTFPEGAVRASFGPFNTAQDAEKLGEAVHALATGSL